MTEHKLTQILVNNSANSLQAQIAMADVAHMDSLFSKIDSRDEEQATYFPFNPENPIYKAHGICPITTCVHTDIDSKSILLSLGGSLMNSNLVPMLNIKLNMEFDLRDESFCIFIKNVSNDSASQQNKHRNFAAYFMNALQNFLAYSNNPDCLQLSATDEGKNYWTKWFDFYDTTPSAIDGYRRGFANTLSRVAPRDQANDIVRHLRYPVQFQRVGELLDSCDRRIGRMAMRKGPTWNGRCGLEEMRDDHYVRCKGLEMLAERGIKPEHPADFQKVITRKLKEHVNYSL